MCDPKAPQLTEVDNSPPMGWGTTLAWSERVDRWKRENRRHRRGAPGPRLLKNPAPEEVGELPRMKKEFSTTKIIFSDGDSFTRQAERRCRVGGTPPIPLEQGFWLVYNYHNLEFIGDFTATSALLKTRKNEMASTFARKLRQLNKIGTELKTKEKQNEQR